MPTSNLVEESAFHNLSRLASEPSNQRVTGPLLNQMKPVSTIVMPRKTLQFTTKGSQVGDVACTLALLHHGKLAGEHP
jgi:hypothetical protein